MELRGHGQREALQRLREEQPNMRAALAWLETRPGEPRLSADDGRFARSVLAPRAAPRRPRGPRPGSSSNGDASPAARARALQAVSVVERPRACLVHPSPRCAETAQESLAIFEDLGDPSRAALSRVLLAVEGVTGANAERAEELLREAQAQFDRDGDQWGEAVIGFVRMETALKSGDEETAIPIGRATAAAFRQLDDPWGLSAILYHLGWGLRQFGRYEEGARVLEEAIDVATSAGLYNTVQWALADLGVAQLHLGNMDLSRDLFDRASAASEYIGDGAGAVLAGYGYGLLAQVRGDWGEARERFAAAHEGFGTLARRFPRDSHSPALARCDEAEGDLPCPRSAMSRCLRPAGRWGSRV